MRKNLLRTAAAVCFLSAASAANAAHVQIDFSGVGIQTQAEIDYPTLWGVDAWGNSIIGQAYTATILYNTSAGTTVIDAGGGQSQAQIPGTALDFFTVNGHSYHSTSTSGLAVYQRASDFLMLNISNTPSDYEGLFFESITTKLISPDLNAPVSLSLGDFLVDPVTGLASGGNVVLAGSNGGSLFGNFSVTSVTISVSAPEPSTWALMLAGFAGLGLLARRRSALASRA
jgi:hypothetical protein